MKKSSIYVIVSVLFISATGFIVYKYNNDVNKKKTAHYELKPRTGKNMQMVEWVNTQRRAQALLELAKRNPEDIKSRIALASLYIQEARITGNYAYYDMAAMKYVNDVLKIDPSNFEGLTLKALLFISQHHFAEGLAIAEQAQKINPHNAFVYGILVDGNVEMGNYETAVEYSDKMVSIRPDIRSYSRISYLREIHGDYNGAIEAMKMAVEAGGAGDESTEWARIQLGQLYEKNGDYLNAKMHYTIALDERPGYAYGLAGMARIALHEKNHNSAIAYYASADSSINDYSLKEELADVYYAAGEKKKGDELIRNIIDEMKKNAATVNEEDSAGHYADMELAHAYLKINEYDNALQHALMEYNRRPGNIDVNETVAWVYYKQGNYEKAVPYIKAAMKTKSKKPGLLCRAGLIYAKTGDKAIAKALIQEGLKHAATIGHELETESVNTIKTL